MPLLSKKFHSNNFPTQEQLTKYDVTDNFPSMTQIHQLALAIYFKFTYNFNLYVKKISILLFDDHIMELIQVIYKISKDDLDHLDHLNTS